MSVERVYVGESGGENLDVAPHAGKARFEPGDTVQVPKELAERLDASWDTKGSERGKAALKVAKESAPAEQADATAEPEATQEPNDEGGSQ